MSDKTATTHSLPTRAVIGYGVGDFASSLAVTTNALFLLDYGTGALKLSPVYVGIWLLVGKIVDAVIDPVIGEVVDRTRHKWGQKRPYLLYGALPFGLSFMMLYGIPMFESETLRLTLFGLFCVLQSIFFSIANIPYTAMTASLTEDATERTRLTMYRFGFSIFASLCTALATQEIAKASSFTVVGVLYGVLMIGTLLVTFFTTEEPPPPKEVPPFSFGEIAKTYRSALGNPHLRTLLGMFFFQTIGFALLAAWTTFFAKYTLKMDGDTFVLGPMFVASLLFLVLWYQVSLRVGKKLGYIIGLSFSAISLLLMFIPQPGYLPVTIAVATAVGIGFASYNLFPYAMLPDVIEIDELMQLRQLDDDPDAQVNRREGSFYGIWVFSETLARGCAFLVGGFGLWLAGFEKGAKTQPAAFGENLRILISLAPLLFVVIGMVFLWKYRLTEDKHAEARAELEERRGTRLTMEARQEAAEGGSESDEAAQ